MSREQSPLGVPMGDPQLDRLFRVQAFVADLLSVADLPGSAWEAVREVLAKADSPLATEQFTAKDIRAVATAANLDPQTAFQALRVAATLANYLGTGPAAPEALSERIRAELAERASSSELLKQIPSLSRISDAVRDRQARSALIAEGGRTVGEISVVADLRLRFANDLPKSAEELETYTPEIKELLPVALLRISFSSLDDGEDCTFQLSLPELEALIIQLTTARKQLEASLATVSARRQEMNST